MQEIKNILCPIAGSEVSPFVLDAAASMAGKFGAALTVLNVAPLSTIDLMRPYGALVTANDDLLPKQVEERLTEHSREVLARAKEQLAGFDAKFQSVIGHPADVICGTAMEGRFDLIVIGNRKKGAPFQRMILGSVCDYVVHHSPCGVLVVRHSAPAES